MTTWNIIRKGDVILESTTDPDKTLKQKYISKDGKWYDEHGEVRVQISPFTEDLNHV